MRPITASTILRLSKSLTRLRYAGNQGCTIGAYRKGQDQPQEGWVQAPEAPDSGLSRVKHGASRVCGLGSIPGEQVGG